MEIEEVYNVTVANAVYQIAYDASAKESETYLNLRAFEGEVSPKDEYGEQGYYGQQGKPEALSGEEAPGSTSIAHVHNVEEARYDRYGVRRLITVERQGFVYP